MTARPKIEALSFRRAFEAERLRREEERRAHDEAERRRQAEDLACAEALHAALAEDEAFLQERGLTVDRRRYTVALHHNDFLIDAYFEAGVATVRSADKRGPTGAALPPKQQQVNSVEAALDVMAHYLADETR
jgi:hypothetical protein